MADERSGWPDDFAAVFAHALPERLIAAAAAESDAMAAVEENFWVPREVIEPATRSPCNLAEQVVCELYDRVMKERLPADWAGAEWWCQVYQRSRGLAFHWDKDEKELLATGEMVHPALSTVIYLNTASECAPVPLGATLVMQQHFDAVAGCGVPEPSRRDVLVWPSHNALLVFDGALAHGVLDSPSPHVRRTLLVNWWSKQPRSVARASAADAEKHALAPPLPGIAAAPPASRVRIPVCELRAATDCVEGPAALMAVLEQHGCGPAATPAVAVHHPDTVVWQVEGAEDEPLPEVADAPDAAAAYAPLVAAVIPDELAANLDSGSESSSGTDADQ